MRSRVLIVWLALIGAASCGDDTPTSPSGTANVAGTWSGTAVSGPSSVQFTLSAALLQTGTSVNGTLTCSGQHPCQVPVTAIFGYLAGNTLTAQTTSSGGVVVCGSFTATVSGNAMAGSYSCANGDSGSWNMTR